MGNAALALLLAVVGFVVPWKVFSEGLPRFGPPADQQDAKRRIWLFSQGVLGALCLCSSFIIGLDIYSFCKDGKISPKEVADLSILFVVLVVLGEVWCWRAIDDDFFGNEPKGLRRNSARLLRMSMVFLIPLGLLPIGGLWVVQIALQKVVVGDINELLVEFLKLRGYIDKFLLIASFQFAIGTLSAAALRSFAISIHQNTELEKRYPRESIFVWGGTYSLLLSIGVAPAYIGLLDIGEQIRTAAIPRLVNPNEIDKWLSARKSLDDLLQLRLSDLMSSGGLAVVIPAAVGILSALAGDKNDK